MSPRPEDIIRDEILALKAYHVPDASGMVKLDAMENPYRLPQELRDRIAALAARAELNRYPDPGAARLKARLRETLAIPEGAGLLLGNGSDEIIQMIILATARPGAVVMSVDPTFVMFRMIATYCGVRYVGVPLRSDYTLDADAFVHAMSEHRPAVVFIAYPNNPTGDLFDASALERVLRAAPGLVVVDEAYHAFAGRSVLPRLADHPNVLVMRTLSKLGLAGLRLGLLAGAPGWLDAIDKVRLPYNVNVLTQVVAELVLQHAGELDAQAAAIRGERSRLAAALAGVPGTVVFPSQANFILFRVPAATAAFGALRQRGVLVKNLDGSHPMLADCLRVTVGTPDENNRFLDALRQVVNA